jgi:hypothetical protein
MQHQQRHQMKQAVSTWNHVIMLTGVKTRMAKVWLLVVSFLCLGTLVLYPHHGEAMVETIFSEDFELGQGLWFADNGVWEVGTPTYGPAECHQGAPSVRGLF